MSGARPGPADTVAAVVLAGGRGTRMAGADKGLLPLRGRPLVAQLLDELRPQVGVCFISANRNHDRYARYGAEVVSDAWPNFRGPLAGIHAAAQRSACSWLLAAPCDSPGLPEDLVLQLQCAAQAAGSAAAYAVVQGELVYPLCLIHRRSFADLQQALERGEYAVGRWLLAQRAVAVVIDNWRGPPLNLNTPERLAAAHAISPWNPSSRT